MKEQHIKELNGLEKDGYAQCLRLCQLYDGKELIVGDLLAALEGNQLIISPTVIFYFAKKYFNLELPEHLNFQKLYEYAAEEGSCIAAYEAAIHYLNGTNLIKRDLGKAIGFFKFSLRELKGNNDCWCEYGLAFAYFELKEYDKAIDYCKQVKQDNRAYKNVAVLRQKTELYKIYQELNKPEYQIPKFGKTLIVAEEMKQAAMVDPKPQNAAADIKSVDVSKAAPNLLDLATSKPTDAKSDKKVVKQLPLVRLSPILDGYNLAYPIFTQLQLRKSEFDSVKEVLTLARRQLFGPISQNLPSETVQGLFLKVRELTNQEKASEINYENAKREHDAFLDAAFSKELQRQVQTEKHFFSAARTQKQKTREMALLLQDNRMLTDAKDVKLISVSGIPARRMITAELSTIKASLEIHGRGDGYNTNLGWNSVNSKRKTLYFPHEQKANLEKVLLGNSEIRYRHKIHPHCNHMGDYHMEDLGSYKNIICDINSVTGTTAGNKQVEKEKQLAALMLRFSKTGKAVTLEELKQLKAAANEDAVIKINRIFYHCFVKEIVRWMQPKDPSHELPLAIAQLRAVKLIQIDILCMEDVFAQFAPYGVFTGKEIGKNIDEVRKKIRLINSLYLESILKEKPEGMVQHMTFFKQHKDAEFITTRAQLHRELQETYGAESDTDDEGYDSDTAEILYPRNSTF